MTIRPKSAAKTCYAALLLALGLVAAPAVKAQSGTGTAVLTVTMNVQSSISLVFNNNAAVGSPGFCPLSNAGTNNVGLDLGSGSFPGGATSSCVSYAHVGPATYQVASAFDVVVSKANTNSPGYKLAAQISTAPPANVAWLINNITLTNTGFTTLDANDGYGAAVTKTLQVQVKNSVAAQVLTETITFLATAN